jgi:hypothetical protein
MTHKVNVSISYEPPGQPMEFHDVGAVADLSAWPPEDIAKMESEGTVTPVDTQVTPLDATSKIIQTIETVHDTLFGPDGTTTAIAYEAIPAPERTD